MSLVWAKLCVAGARLERLTTDLSLAEGVKHYGSGKHWEQELGQPNDGALLEISAVFKVNSSSVVR